MGKGYVGIERNIVTKPSFKLFFFGYLVITSIVLLVFMFTFNKKDEDGKKDYETMLAYAIVFAVGILLIFLYLYILLSWRAGRFEAECGEAPGKNASARRKREFNQCVGRLQGQNRVLDAVQYGGMYNMFA